MCMFIFYLFLNLLISCYILFFIFIIFNNTIFIILYFSVPQTLILSRACGFDISWAEVLLSQYVVLGHAHYLQEYLQHLQINDNIIENTVKGWVLLLIYSNTCI